jgi:hypothetical protein
MLLPPDFADKIERVTKIVYYDDMLSLRMPPFRSKICDVFHCPLKMG